MSKTDVVIVVVGGSQGIYTSGDNISILSATGQTVAGLVSAIGRVGVAFATAGIVGLSRLDVNHPLTSKWQEAKNTTSPLILDLDGDGLVETTSKSHNVYFDYAGDGFAEATSWTSSGSNNEHKQTSAYTATAGATRAVHDVWFATANQSQWSLVA